MESDRFLAICVGTFTLHLANNAGRNLHSIPAFARGTVKVKRHHVGAGGIPAIGTIVLAHTRKIRTLRLLVVVLPVHHWDPVCTILLRSWIVVDATTPLHTQVLHPMASVSTADLDGDPTIEINTKWKEKRKNKK